MSNCASPIVAYGFDLGDEESLGQKLAGILDLIETSYAMKDSKWPVELIPHGHHEYRYWFLSIRGSRISGGEWGSLVHFPVATPDAAKIEAAEAWCKEHNIPWQTPQWSAVATYD